MLNHLVSKYLKIRVSLLTVQQHFPHWMIAIAVVTIRYHRRTCQNIVSICGVQQATGHSTPSVVSTQMSILLRTRSARNNVSDQDNILEKSDVMGAFVEG